MFEIFQLFGFLFQLLFWGLIIGGVIIVVRFFMNLSKVSEEEIVQRWSQLIPGQGDLKLFWIEKVRSAYFADCDHPYRSLRPMPER